MNLTMFLLNSYTTSVYVGYVKFNSIVAMYSVRKGFQIFKFLFNRDYKTQLVK